MKFSPMIIPRIAVFALLCLCATAALAKPEFLQVVKSAGLIKPGGKLDTAGCNLCHAGGPPKLNVYGKQLKPLIDNVPGQTLTPEILKQVADKDADGDGATNAYEFEQDTFPGDATSKPKVAQVVKKTTTKSATSGDGIERSAIAKLLFPKHGQHPVLVHFPLALFVISFLFDFFGSRKNNHGLLEAGYFNLIVATLFAPITVLTGLLAWQFAYGGISVASLGQNQNLLLHLIMGTTSAIAMFVAWRMRFKLRDTGALPKGYLIAAALIFALVIVTGHLGGNLVYSE